MRKQFHAIHTMTIYLISLFVWYETLARRTHCNLLINCSSTFSATEVFLKVVYCNGVNKLPQSFVNEVYVYTAMSIFVRLLLRADILLKNIKMEAFFFNMKGAKENTLYSSYKLLIHCSCYPSVFKSCPLHMCQNTSAIICICSFISNEFIKYVDGS